MLCEMNMELETSLKTQLKEQVSYCVLTTHKDKLSRFEETFEDENVQDVVYEDGFTETYVEFIFVYIYRCTSNLARLNTLNMCSLYQ